MSAPDFERVKAVFRHARRLPVEERDAYVTEECGDDVELRNEVEELLAHDASDSDPAPEALLGVRLGEWSGGDPAGRPDRIGPFKILDLLGEGGMGTVYRARQHTPDRIIALKLLRHGITNPEAAQRFALEANVLGRLRHPAIAQVFEVGHHDGPDGPRPYFAMEWIEGAPVDQFVRDRNLGLRERLELMIRICGGVQHAHEKGVIHRDLKPANILVTDGTDSGPERDRGASVRAVQAMPKILDFGVARVTDADVQRATRATRQGEIVGTLPYMSPEQAAGDPHDVDTRSDVYALGVLLYEVLGGQLPLDLADCSLPEACRRIQDHEPPLLGTLDRRLRGDLETIAARALAKERERRYESAAALAEDLQRYLADEPVSARPASAAYQLRKFARRHRALVVGAAVAAVLLLVAAAGTGWGMWKASQEARRAESLNQFLADVLTTVDPDAGGAGTRLLDMADRASAEVHARFGDDPEQEARVRELLAEMYLSQSMDDQAIDQLDQAIELLQPDPGSLDPRVLRMRTRRVSALHRRDRYRDVEAEVGELLPLVLEGLGPDDASTLHLRRLEAWLISRRGGWADAEDLLRRLRDDCERALGSEHEVTDGVVTALVAVLRAQARRLPPEEGGPYLVEAIGLAEQRIERQSDLHGPQSVRVMNATLQLCELFEGSGEWSRMEALVLQVLGHAEGRLDEHHVLRQEAAQHLAVAIAHQGRADEALEWIDRCIESRRATLKPGHPIVMQAECFGALTALQANRPDRAETYTRACLDSLSDLPKSMHMMFELPRALYVSALVDQGRLDEALPMLEALEESNPYLAIPERVLLRLAFASLECRRGQPEQATATLANAQELASQVQDREPWLIEKVQSRRQQLEPCLKGADSSE